MTVDRKRLEEARDFLNEWDIDAEWVDAAFVTIDRFLQAPTVRWCNTHADRVMPHIAEDRCRWSVKVNGDKPCEFSTIAAVPVDDA